MTHSLSVIAHIRNDFTAKFGIPRQSGLVDTIISKIVFEPEYRNPDAFRGIEGYSHLWLIWQFSEAVRNEWSPTVRPPRLGGNKRMGVFATRSPFRPNPIGLSSVKLVGIDLHTSEGPVLYVTGADILDGTPIYDVKPYLAYTDSHPEATGGFAKGPGEGSLSVEISDELKKKIPESLFEGAIALLREDPRPGYQNDPDRVYMMEFGSIEIHFTVNETKLTVKNILNLKK
jgi:tRNA-Thr(GGU) m(6)t(6)A37 methyltransferase TsaA